MNEHQDYLKCESRPTERKSYPGCQPPPDWDCYIPKEAVLQLIRENFRTLYEEMKREDSLRDLRSGKIVLRTLEARPGE